MQLLLRNKLYSVALLTQPADFEIVGEPVNRHYGYFPPLYFPRKTLTTV